MSGLRASLGISQLRLPWLKIMRVLFMASGALHAGCAGGHAQSISEDNLRRLSTRQYVPSYPDESLRNGTTGVAVVAVVIRPDGMVSRADLLQAPDKPIGREVTRTAKRWVFKEHLPAEFVGPREGRLTFYFRVVDGQGGVLDPQQMLLAVTAGANR